MNTTSTSNKRRRWPWIVLAILVVLGLAAWLGSYALRGGGDPKAGPPVAVTPALVARGAYLARAGDCVACHTAPGGAPFAGGLPIASPIGKIYSSNITPDRDSGIGGWSYGQFERAVRRGIGHDGTPLYPAMPFPSYARVTDEDVAALYAYFMQGVRPVSQKDKPTDIPWPLSLRWPLAWWRTLFAPTPEKALAAAAPADPAVARGAYLVEGLGHCGSCHTPRALTLQEKALSDADGSLYLSGGSADNWIAPSLRGEPVSGLGQWSPEKIATFLQTGRTGDSAAFGGMADVVQHSTGYMDTEDLGAIAAYLKTLAPHRQETAAQDDGKAAATLLAATPGDDLGARVYLDTCNTCHRSKGQGWQGVYPALAGNAAVNSTDPTGLINLVISGGIMPTTRAAPAQFAMPAFGERLSDADVAAVLTFVRRSWGNRAAAVDPAKVKSVRAALKTPENPYSLYDPRQNQPQTQRNQEGTSRAEDAAAQ